MEPAPECGPRAGSPGAAFPLIVLCRFPHRPTPPSRPPSAGPRSNRKHLEGPSGKARAHRSSLGAVPPAPLGPGTVVWPLVYPPDPGYLPGFVLSGGWGWILSICLVPTYTLACLGHPMASRDSSDHRSPAPQSATAGGGGGRLNSCNTPRLAGGSFCPAPLVTPPFPPAPSTDRASGLFFSSSKDDSPLQTRGARAAAGFRHAPARVLSARALQNMIRPILHV